MRLCLVCPYSWSFPGGVVEHLDSLAAHLMGRGHEVSILAPNDPLDLRTRLLHPGLGRHDPPPPYVTTIGRSIPLPSNGSLANIAFSPSVFRRVRRALREQQPHVIHIHEPLLPLVSWAAMMAARELRIPTVGTFHANYPEGCTHYTLFEPVLRPLFQRLSAAIAVSQTAAETTAAHFPGDYQVVPNGVDVRRFRPSGSERNPNQILFVGRPASRKGLPLLLDALPRVLERVPDARLLIVGSDFEELKIPKRLLSSIEVAGIVNGEDLVANMHSSSLLCAPSTGGESFGIVLIEAMAAGLPVVATSIPGYEAVVNSGENGVLVPPGDSGALARALVSLLQDPERRSELSMAGQLSVMRYDWPRIVTTLEDVYARVSRL